MANHRWVVLLHLGQLAVQPLAKSGALLMARFALKFPIIGELAERSVAER